MTPPDIKCVSDLLHALKDMPPEAVPVDSWGSPILSVELDEGGDVVLVDE